MLSLIVQTAAYLTTFASMWYCGKKSLAGPAFGVLSSILWVALAYGLQAPLMVAFEVAMLGLEARVLWLWYRATKKTC